MNYNKLVSTELVCGHIRDRTTDAHSYSTRTYGLRAITLWQGQLPAYLGSDALETALHPLTYDSERWVPQWLKIMVEHRILGLPTKSKEAAEAVIAALTAVNEENWEQFEAVLAILEVAEEQNRVINPHFANLNVESFQGTLRELQQQVYAPSHMYVSHDTMQQMEMVMKALEDGTLSSECEDDVSTHTL